MRRLCVLALSAVAPLGLWSCAASARQAAPPHEAVPGLALPNSALLVLGADEAAGWEASRNELPRDRQATPPFRQWRWLEVRHREHLRTINGRPSEFSTTTTRSLQRGLRR